MNSWDYAARVTGHLKSGRRSMHLTAPPVRASISGHRSSGTTFHCETAWDEILNQLPTTLGPPAFRMSCFVICLSMRIRVRPAYAVVKRQLRHRVVSAS